jgi:hypothetical protein
VFWIAGAVAIVLAAVIGAIAGGSGSSGTKTAPYVSSASAGPIELSFPDTWERGGATAAIPGLTLSEPIALEPVAGQAASSLQAGTTDAGGATLLPASFTALVSGGLPKPTQVKLGGVDALRYANVSVRGMSAPLTVYTVPTTEGVVTIACSGPPAAVETATCQRIAGTLHLMGATAYPLGPDAAYAATLSHTFSTLSSARSSAESALASAKTPSAQAKAATQLAGLYAAAAHALGALHLSPAIAPTNDQIAAALTALSTAYTHAAHAASRQDSGGYKLAATAVGRDSAQLASALSQLHSAGY